MASADEAADQLDALLENLLDLSRLQTGVLVPLRRATSVDEVVHRALIGIPIGLIRDSIPDDLPLIDTDSGLLERVIANITANAVRHSPPSTRSVARTTAPAACRAAVSECAFIAVSGSSCTDFPASAATRSR